MSRDNNKEWSKCEQGQYKYCVISGNNSGLVKRVLETRDHWTELQEKYSTSLFNFKWSPVSRSCHFRYLGVNGLKNMVNHFERHEQLTAKDHLFQNMLRLCENNKLNVFDYMPIQFVFDFYNINFQSEIERFTQYFNCLAKVDPKSEDPISRINESINSSRQFRDKRHCRKFDMSPCFYSGSNVWLIKPNDFNRGRGVLLFNSLQQLVSQLKELT